MSAELKTSRHNATLILTLSNPAAKNALHPDIYAAAIEALSTAERDDSIRALILTGADNFFCSGGNLTRLLQARANDLAEQAEELDHLQGWIDAMRECPKPIIAAVDGAAAGTGFSLALACDLIVAGVDAQFQMASVRVGLTPDGGSSWFLTRALPQQLAAEMMLEGKPVSAERLHRLGIVNKLAANGMALPAAIGWADDLAKQSPNALEQIKNLIGCAHANTFAQHVAAEKECFVNALYHPDSLEGINAFLEKRTPIYK